MNMQEKYFYFHVCSYKAIFPLHSSQTWGNMQMQLCKKEMGRGLSIKKGKNVCLVTCWSKSAKGLLALIVFST